MYLGGKLDQFLFILKKNLSQGTCIKDPWTKPKGCRIEGGRWGWVEQGRVRGRKWRQLYLNNIEKRKEKKKAPEDQPEDEGDSAAGRT